MKCPLFYSNKFQVKSAKLGTVKSGIILASQRGNSKKIRACLSKEF